MGVLRQRAEVKGAGWEEDSGGQCRERCGDRDRDEIEGERDRGREREKERERRQEEKEREREGRH